MKIDSVKPGTPKRATYLSLIAVLLFMGCLNYAVVFNGMQVKDTVWALTPPLIAISLALITKEVYSSLFIGILSGALLITGFEPVHRSQFGPWAGPQYGDTCQRSLEGIACGLLQSLGLQGVAHNRTHTVLAY